jgi:hypothetical protein
MPLEALGVLVLIARPGSAENTSETVASAKGVSAPSFDFQAGLTA